MTKLLHFLLFYSAVSIITANRFDRLPWFFNFMRPYFTPASICENSTTQAAYLAKANVLIASFEANTTYNSVLQLDSSNLVSFLKDPSNQALLYNNCTAFVNGLKVAKSADKTKVRARQTIAEEINSRFQQISRDVTGRQGRSELDSN